MTISVWSAILVCSFFRSKRNDLSETSHSCNAVIKSFVWTASPEMGVMSFNSNVCPPFNYTWEIIIVFRHIPVFHVLHLCNILIFCLGLVPGRQSSLSVIARVFDTLNAVYKEHLKAASSRPSSVRFSPSFFTGVSCCNFPCVWVSCWFRNIHVLTDSLWKSSTAIK